MNIDRDEELKSKLPPGGPWIEEPDRVEWRYRGFPCLMVRNRLGVWCGYVAVLRGHPWYDKEDCPAEAHGGITYGDRCQGKICHSPQPGESDDVWWIGFDCAHAWDVIPELLKYSSHGHRRWPPEDSDTTYKDLAWVTAEVERLADQAMEATR